MKSSFPLWFPPSLKSFGRAGKARPFGYFQTDTANFQNSDFGRPFEYATLMAYSQENRQENILTFLRMRECYLWEVERRIAKEPVKNVGSDFMKAKSGLFLNKIKLDDIIIIWNSITLQLQQKLLTWRF